MPAYLRPKISYHNDLSKSIFFAENSDSMRIYSEITIALQNFLTSDYLDAFHFLSGILDLTLKQIENTVCQQHTNLRSCLLI